MKILKSIIISFSLYSKIPMPIFEWDEDNMKHAIAFLPFVGGVTGAVSFALFKLLLPYMAGGGGLQIPVLPVTLILILIPIFVTGGFHIDGFMDVQDALHSYRPKEKKLEIMKDPHIGAFAVISAGTVLVIWVASLYLLIFRGLQTGDYSLIYIYHILFLVVRGLCGITSIVFENAKKEGMLSMETGKSTKGDVIFLVVQVVLAVAYMLYLNPVSVGVLVPVLFLFVLWYKNMCKSQFGGVTGDTAGFFVVMGETVLLITISLLSLI